MAGDKMPPEEKLLNLIKDAGINKAKKKFRSYADKREGKRIFKRMGYAIKKIFFKRGAALLRRPNPLLASIIILLFAFIGYRSRSDIGVKNRINLSPHQNLWRGGVPGQDKGAERKEILQESILLKPYSYYLDAMGKKSVFSPLVIDKPAVSGGGAEKAKIIEELCRGYQLKGVILGERPEAFIEEVQTRRVFTVTVGDNIGKVRVIAIKEGRVTLGYENESYDLVF